MYCLLTSFDPLLENVYDIVTRIQERGLYIAYPGPRMNRRQV